MPLICGAMQKYPFKALWEFTLKCLWMPNWLDCTMGVKPLAPQAYNIGTHVVEAHFNSLKLCIANIGSDIGYQPFLVTLTSDIGKFQKPISIQL